MSEMTPAVGAGLKAGLPTSRAVHSPSELFAQPPEKKKEQKERLGIDSIMVTQKDSHNLRLQSPRVRPLHHLQPETSSAL